MCFWRFSCFLNGNLSMTDKNPMPLSEEEKLSRLRLSRTDSISTRIFWRLLKEYSSAKNAIEHLKDSKKFKICEKDVVSRELEDIKKIGAELVFYEDKLYPPLLRQISDAPPVLSVLGINNLKEFTKRKVIAIVGARNSSILANRFCKQVAEDLGNNGFVVISGLARGIDAQAHSATLKTGTIAVLASGINVVYPKENQKLYDAIKEQGVILAEMPFETPPQSSLFPKRNRIIAAAASGVLVIEAARQSGSLITARCALEYNRDVFAAPGFPLDLRSEGSNLLIKEGAIMTLSARDILEHTYSQPTQQKVFEFSDVQTADYFVSDENIGSKILNALSTTPITIDELIFSIKLSPQEVLSALIDLELKNKILRLSGQRVCLV